MPRKMNVVLQPHDGAPLNAPSSEFQFTNAFWTAAASFVPNPCDHWALIPDWPAAVAYEVHRITAFGVVLAGHDPPVDKLTVWSPVAPGEVNTPLRTASVAI
jgi:hypothetical protein